MIHQEAELLLAAGAALDDLEADERAAYEAHRQGCSQCAVLEDELSMVLADLSLLVPERVPPADLFAGIRLAIDAEDARAAAASPGSPAGLTGQAGATPAPQAGARLGVAPAGYADGAGPSSFAAPVPTAPPPVPQAPALPDNVIPITAARGSRRPVYAAVGLAAVFAFAAVGLGVRTVGLQDDLDQSQAQVAQLRSEMALQGGAMAAAMNPSHVTVALQSEPIAEGAAAVVVFVPGTDSSYIVAENLPATPSGHGYQLWYADAEGVHALQTVPWDGNGAFVAPLDVDLAQSKAVMITLEETGGAQGDPGPQVIYGEL